MHFTTPEREPTIEELVKSWKRKEATAKRKEKKALASPPKPVKKATVPVEKSGAWVHRRQRCESEDCMTTPCPRGAYARDPLAKAAGETLWVCRNRYMRSWRKQQTQKGRKYDSRHRDVKDRGPQGGDTVAPFLPGLVTTNREEV